MDSETQIYYLHQLILIRVDILRLITFVQSTSNYTRVFNFVFIPWLLVQIIVEFGSFDKYIWGFVNQNPTVNQFRYPRQVPIKTSKADAISKDLVRRGFRGVGPTVVYSFMQVVGMTNDHLVSCFRFQECIDAADASSKDGTLEGTVKEDKQPDSSIELGLGRGIDNLSLSSTE